MRRAIDEDSFWLAPFIATAATTETPKIAVIGLGYVGLPLALALARYFEVVGFDISEARLDALRAHHDNTGEASADALKSSTMQLTNDGQALIGADIFIVTVPTPIDAQNRPDLSAVTDASRAVAKALKKGAIVVFESTVYPGVTEDICGPLIAEVSGLACGEDFYLGYSPERINPGDKEHGLENITKVIAGQTPEVSAVLRRVYGAVNDDDIFVAKDIRTAEAAKVIENAQRDINIAFVNEVAMIFSKMGLSTHDILAAARTKWNFLPFMPGLVGGHCIGVDPFYLSHAAEQNDHHAEVILAGRRINDGMAKFLADGIDAQLQSASRILVMGLTFKENVPDLRNSKAADMVAALKGHGHDVTVLDPIADADEAENIYAITPVQSVEGLRAFDCIVGTVPHDAFRKMSPAALTGLVVEGGLVADIKAIWRDLALPASVRRWNL